MAAQPAPATLAAAAGYTRTIYSSNISKQESAFACEKKLHTEKLTRI